MRLWPPFLEGFYRAAVGWMITIAAGGAVMIDVRSWNGGDPAKLFGPEAIAVVAATDRLAERLSALPAAG